MSARPGGSSERTLEVTGFGSQPRGPLLGAAYKVAAAPLKPERDSESATEVRIVHTPFTKATSPHPCHMRLVTSKSGPTHSPEGIRQRHGCREVAIAGAFLRPARNTLDTSMGQIQIKTLPAHPAWILSQTTQLLQYTLEALGKF